MSGLRTLHADPPTFMEMLVECSQFLDRARHDEGCTKHDVLESMENRLSMLIGKLASQPTSAAFAIPLLSQGGGKNEPAGSIRTSPPGG